MNAAALGIERELAAAVLVMLGDKPTRSTRKPTFTLAQGERS
jgi:hypothetical protein